MTAKDEETVVFPTPPLPPTKIVRGVEEEDVDEDRSSTNEWIEFNAVLVLVPVALLCFDAAPRNGTCCFLNVDN